MNIPTDALLEWASDPLQFFGAAWPDAKIYHKQAEILESVNSNKTTWVHSAAGMGKDWVAARCIVWFFCTRFPAKVVATSTSEKQLKNVLWGEISEAIRTSRIPLPISKKHLRLDFRDSESGGVFDNHFVELAVARDVESFQGYHLDDDIVPRVLFVYDECSSVRDEFYDAAESQAHRILAIGNPIKTRGLFAAKCKQGDVLDPFSPEAFLHKVIHIDGLDSPNVRLGFRYKEAGIKGRPPRPIPGVLTFEDFVVRDMTWDAANKAARLHGLFHSGDASQMFPEAWFSEAETAHLSIKDRDRGPYYLGIDVAAGGRDSSCFVVMDRFGVVEMLVMDTPDTTVLPKHTLRLMAKYDIMPNHVCVDAGGGGKQAIVDILNAKKVYTKSVSFGGGASNPRLHKNRRVEMFAELSKAMNPAHWRKMADVNEDGEQVEMDEWARCFSLPTGPEFDELQNEMLPFPVNYDAEGKQILPPKDRTNKSKEQTLVELIGHSPDRADALALANWAMVSGRKEATPTVSGSLVYNPVKTNGKEPTAKPEQPAGGSLAERILGPGGLNRGSGVM